jgi:hypothetical protein
VLKRKNWPNNTLFSIKMIIFVHNYYANFKTIKKS